MKFHWDFRASSRLPVLSKPGFVLEQVQRSITWINRETAKRWWEGMSLAERVLGRDMIPPCKHVWGGQRRRKSTGGFCTLPCPRFAPHRAASPTSPPSPPPARCLPRLAFLSHISRDVQRPHRPHGKSAPLTVSLFFSFLLAAAVRLMKTLWLCKLSVLTCAQPVRCWTRPGERGRGCLREGCLRPPC